MTEVEEKKVDVVVSEEPKKMDDEVAKTEIKDDLKENKGDVGSEVKSETNGSIDASKQRARIVRQVEHYFGNFNLPRDKFLRAESQMNEGWIPISTLLRFKRLQAMCSEPKTILEALKSQSSLMQVDLEKEAVRRDPAQPLPDWTSDEEKRKAHLLNTTVYLKGFEKTKTTLDELIDFFQDKYEGVANVVMRTYVDKKDEEKRKFKGSVFVNFLDRAKAEEFMKLDKVENEKGEELVRKWQKDYFDEKEQEYNERKKMRNESRNKKAGNKEDSKKDENKKDNKEDKQDDFTLPKGSVLELKNLGDTCSRESIKSCLESKFDVQPSTIAFIYYDKGETEARIRFKEEEAAIKLVSKMKEKCPDNELVVEGEQKSSFGLLEGEEEANFLKQCVQDIRAVRSRNRGGHKRRGGWGGQRGGKRGRR